MYFTILLKLLPMINNNQLHPVTGAANPKMTEYVTMPSSPHLPKSVDVQVPYSGPKDNRAKPPRFKGPEVCRRLKSVVRIISPIQGLLWLCRVPSRSSHIRLVE